VNDLFDFSGPIKAISLWQPWASLMALGLKPDETRHWATSYRGLCAIHAARTIDVAGSPDDLCAAAIGPNWGRLVPIGMVLAIGRLTACREASRAVAEGLTKANLAAGNFTPGRFAWRFEDIRPLMAPIPLIGRQGLFNWTPPDDIAERLGPPRDHAEACSKIGWTA